jgi:hypothetical protein
MITLTMEPTCAKHISFLKKADESVEKNQRLNDYVEKINQKMQQMETNR